MGTSSSNTNIPHPPPESGNQTVAISKKLVLINTLSSLLRAFLHLLVVVWLQQYLLKRITAEEYSLLPVVGAIMAFVPLVGVILTSGIGRYIVEAYSVGDNDRVTQIVSTITPFLCAGGLLVMLGGGLMLWKVEYVLSIEPSRVAEARIMLGLMLAVFVAGMVLNPFCVGFYARQKFVWVDMLETAGEVLRILLLLLLLFGVSTRVLWVVVASSSAAGSALAVRFVISRRLLPALRFRISAIRRELVKDLLSFGSWSFLGQTATLIRANADVIILQKLATAVDVSAFHLGSLVDRQLRQLTMTATSTVQPALIAMHAKKKEEGLKNAFLRGGRLQLWAVMMFGVPLIIFREEFFSAYLGPSYGLYQAAGPVMALLLGTLILIYGRSWHVKVATATGNIKQLMIWQTISQGCNLALTFVLVGWLQFGALGSALATFAITAVFQFAVFWPLALIQTGISFQRFWSSTLFPGLLPAAMAAIFLEIVHRTLAPERLAVLALVALLGMGLYVTVMISAALQPEDRRDLHRVGQGLAKVWRRMTGRSVN